MERIRRAAVAIHYSVYQTFLAVFGTVACIYILFDYSFGKALGYGVVTVAAYWVGQGIVSLVQRQQQPRRPDARDTSWFE